MKNINTLTATINTIIANGNTTMVEICTEPKMNKRNNPFYNGDEFGVLQNAEKFPSLNAQLVLYPATNLQSG